MAETNSIAIPPRVKDLTGKKFGRWTVVQFHPSDTKGHALWLCRCECGTERAVDGASLRSGGTKGCSKCRNRTHGAKGTPEYISWYQMLGRCRNPQCKEYPNYGGRGITVCKRWLSFEAFLEDMGPRPTGMTIDRENNEGHYEPGNCRWATHREQQRNTRRNRLITAFGKTMCVTEWAEETGISSLTLIYRLNAAWTAEDALTTPPRAKRKQ